MKPAQEVRGVVHWSEGPYPLVVIPWTQYAALPASCYVSGPGGAFTLKGVSLKEITFLEVKPQSSWVPFSTKTDPHEIVSHMLVEEGELFAPGVRGGSHVRGFRRVRSRTPAPTHDRSVQYLDLAVPRGY